MTIIFLKTKLITIKFFTNKYDRELELTQTPEETN